MREILLLALSGILADNLICSRCIGVTGGEFNLTTFRSSLLYSLIVTALGTIATAVGYPVLAYVLEPLSLGYFYIALIAALVAAALYGARKLLPKLLGGFSTVQRTVIFATATGLCGIALTQEKYYLALLAALFYGIGLLVLMLVFFCARLSLKESRVPRFLRGTPIDIIIVAIIALIFYGFN